MKTSVRNTVLFFILLLCSLPAQNQTRSWYAGRSGVDSLKKVLATQPADTNKVKTLYDLSSAYFLFRPDSSLAYAQQGLELAEILDHEAGIFWSTTAVCRALMFTGNYPLELEYAFKALSMSKKMDDPRIKGHGNGVLSDCYYNLGEYATSLSYWHEVIKIVEQWFPNEMYAMWMGLSRIHGNMNHPDSAMLYAKKAYEKIRDAQSLSKYWHPRQESLAYMCLGNAFAGKAEYDSALFYYRMSISLSTNNYWEIHLLENYNGVAAVYKATGKLDSAAWYAKKALSAQVAKWYPVSSLKAANLLSDVYELTSRPDSTLKYLRMAIGLKESLFNREKIMEVQNLTYIEQEKQKEIAGSKLKLRNQFILIFLGIVFISVVVIASIVVRNKRQKQLQNIRNSIADDLHDDIGSTLSSISILNELAKEKSPEAKPLLDSIGESTLFIQENMSDIVWSLNAKNDRFENVLLRMNQFASEILEAKNIDLEFTADATVLASRLTMKQRKNLYLFFKEAINNAAKHSAAKNVFVRIFQKRQDVEMIITDNGKGFDRSQTTSGNGMCTLKRRSDELNGNFEIQSQPNAGTIVELKFKIT